MAHEITERIWRVGMTGDRGLLVESDMVNEGGHFFAAVRMGRHFVPVKLWRGSDGQHDSRYPVSDVFWGEIYRPVHPSTTLADIQGATYAIDDGKSWIFAHASEDNHHEMALMVEALTLAAFQPQCERAMLARLGAADAAAIASTTAKLEALYEFRNDVHKAATVALYAEHMGHFHAQPHAGHYRNLIRAAVISVKSIWSGHNTKKLQLPTITTVLESVERDLTPAYTVQTRAAKLAAAEAAKKEAEAETPADPPAETPADPPGGHGH